MIQDAGGVPLADGRRMRSGRVFRVSGALAGPGELAALTRAQLRTIVDLRAELEDRSAVIGWAAEHGVAYGNYPIVVGGYQGDSDNDFARAVADGRHVAFFEAAYGEIATGFGPQLAGAFERLSEGFPAAFGCAAGKDRTGVMSAFLHILLGATEETAIGAYLERAPSVEQLLPTLGPLFGLGPADTPSEGMLYVLGVQRHNIEHALARVGALGGVEAFLRDHGLTAGALARLRTGLIEP